MNPIQIIAQDLFDKIRSRFTNLEMGDETGGVTIDPAEARFFDFDFINEGTNFGRVSISINDLGSLKVYFSRGITENTEQSSKVVWYRFLKEMRQFAMRRLLRFDTRDIAKSNLDKNDFQYLATKQMPKEEENMQMNESMFNGRNSKKTSRRVQGCTEVIVRHNTSVDDMVMGSRSRKKNIKAIFIQNKDGERFKYPFIHIAGAMAMARHVDEGGAPHDDLGRKIIGMSEDIAKLQEFQRNVQHAQLHDDAMGITERTLAKLNHLKSHMESLSKRRYYQEWAANTKESEMLDDDLLELDDVTMEEYKSKFTETHFKEDLKQFFPLIHRIMQETNKVDLDQYLQTSESIDENTQDPNAKDDFDEFSSWADSAEKGELSRQQIDHLKYQIDQQKESGQPLDLADGDPVIKFFSDAGINRENLPSSMVDDFEEKVKVAADEFPDTDPMEIFATWAKQNYPSLLTQLGLDAGSTAQVPSTEDAPIATVHGMMPAVEENEEMSGMPNSTMSKESQEDNEHGQRPSVQEIARIVKQFYNAVNENSAPFRSEESVYLKVETAMEEQYGEDCREYARHVAEQIVKSLKSKWAARHNKDPDSFGPQEMEEVVDPNNPDDYERSAKDRKDAGRPPLTLQQVRDKDERSKRELAQRQAAVDRGKLGETDNPATPATPTTQRDANIAMRNLERDAIKAGHRYNPITLPGHIERMKKLAGITDKN